VPGYTHWVILAAIDAATPPSQKGYGGCFFFFGGVTMDAGVLIALRFCCGLSLMVGVLDDTIGSQIENEKIK
jgi:hypothetical protein